MERMSGKSKTFLEIGSTKCDSIFFSVPTKFSVDSDGTCWVNITKRNFQKIKSLVLKKLNFEITKDLVQNELLKQWNPKAKSVKSLKLIKNIVFFTIR